MLYKLNRLPVIYDNLDKLEEFKSILRFFTDCNFIDYLKVFKLD